MILQQISTSTSAERPKRKPSAKALPKQIGHLDEEGATVAAEAGLELARERTKSVMC